MALRILIVLLILAVPLELPGCGPFLPVAMFHLPGRPEAPEDFARGQLGVLLPSYERLYQVIAYRYLSGVGLNGEEQKAVLPPDVDAPAPSPLNDWLATRNQVAGVIPVKEIDAYRQVKKDGYFDTYLNCNDDAFSTAASTLKRVRTKPFASDWIAAQDMVFSNCSQGANVPQPASDPQLRPERAYQIASAKFYSEQYDAAHQDFQSIAGDTSSPWHEIAPYLAARCSVRAGKLDQAAGELRHVAADPARPRWHAPANGLLGYVDMRLHPAQRMHDLALALVRPDSQATIGQNLIDYRMLFDRPVTPTPDDDLSAWIRSFQSGGHGALEQWRTTHALPWLVAALQAANRQDDNLAELLTAAAAVKSDSPGYLTVNYHRMRLIPEDEARTLAGRLLAGTFPTASQNQIRGQRMGMARDFNDFLRYVPRRPVAVMTDQIEAPEKAEDDLDEDAAGIFNLNLPLSYWKQAQTSSLLPDHVRKELGRVIFVRSLVLSDKPPFDQIFTLLHSPGMQLNVDAGYGRETKEVDKIDNYGDNWWCSMEPPSRLANHETPVAPATNPENAPPHTSPPEHQGPVLAFLTPADVQKADDESARLRAAGAAPDWLSAQTVAFAQAHPQDPRVPEALHLVVRASRYGCTDDKTGDFSKRAFDLLHRSYPNSEWAKKTPYWYK